MLFFHAPQFRNATVGSALLLVGTLQSTRAFSSVDTTSNTAAAIAILETVGPTILQSATALTLVQALDDGQKKLKIEVYFKKSALLAGTSVRTNLDQMYIKYGATTGAPAVGQSAELNDVHVSSSAWSLKRGVQRWIVGIAGMWWLMVVLGMVVSF